MSGLSRDDINKVAVWMMANGYATGHGETMEDLLDELKWQIDEKIAIEREACAKVADEWSIRAIDVGAFIGKAIRARGQG